MLLRFLEKDDCYNLLMLKLISSWYEYFLIGHVFMFYFDFKIVVFYCIKFIYFLIITISNILTKTYFTEIVII